MTAIQVLPKELARLTTQYAHVIGCTRTIAGVPDTPGQADGPALAGAQFNALSAMALDMTDPALGPQLMISESCRVRCLNLRTEMVTTMAGVERGRADGPVACARFAGAYGIAVAPNGALFVVDRGNDCVRRISAAQRGSSGPAERMVT
jgi:hypothetical protein